MPPQVVLPSLIVDAIGHLDEHHQVIVIRLESLSKIKSNLLSGYSHLRGCLKNHLYLSNLRRKESSRQADRQDYKYLCGNSFGYACL